MACKAFAAQHALAPSVISLIDPLNFNSRSVAKRNGMHCDKMAVHRGEKVMVFRVTL
jgi:hypothetical protein